MKILGREISLEKLMSILFRHPEASFMSLINNIRQRFLLGREFSLMPSAIVVEITYSCNLRCKTCWFYGNSGILKEKAAAESLNFEQLKKLADNVSFYKPYIYVTGGEPLINKATIPFINYAKKKGLVTGLVTNGTLLTKENAEKLIDADLDFITVSIDGPEKIHNSIRGMDCFNKTVQGIKNIVAAKNGKKYPIVTINCTISDYNYEYLEEIVKLGDDVKADIVALQHPCFLLKNTIKAHHNIFKKLFDKSDNLIDGYENNSASKINVEKLYRIINRIKNMKKRTDLRLYQDFSFKQMKNYYEKEIAINEKCIAPWFSATIKPNGDITPCLGYVVGNINKESFMDVWNNKRFKNFRNILNKRKFFPGCIRCCGFFFNWR